MVPVRLGFAVFGVFWGTWAVAALDIQQFLEISDSGLGLLVAATVVGTLFANVVGGTLAERLGVHRATTIALAVWAPLVLAMAATPWPVAWMGVFLLVVAAGGLFDVVLNIASAGNLAEQPGRLLRLHATYNTGALAGAALTGVVLAMGLSWRIPVAVTGASAAALTVALRRRPGWIPGVAGIGHVSLRDAATELRRSRLVVLALVFSCGAMVEGGIGTFGVLYLRDHLDVVVLGGAAAYVAGQALATATRAVLGASDARLTGTRAATMGLGLAGTGLLLEVATDHPAVAALGLAVASIGAATYWPLLSAVANKASDRPALAVGGVSAAGYVGFLAGPPLVGLIADGLDLRAGVALLGVVGIAGALTPLRRYRPAPATP